MVRYTVHFTGRVQGVGFRWTTTRVARDHNAAGAVQNLPDGRVKLVVEGEPADLDALVAAVQDAMSGYIRDTKIDKTPATGEFGDPSRGGVRVAH
jgi:acylphosphatase